MHDSDLLIIGGGIVGLASAFQFVRRYPDKRVVVLEKEDDIAKHQTGRNSGVLHSGIYYKPGSLKATNCREGRDAMIAFCEEENIPFEICGKVIVAVDASELHSLERIFQRGQENGVACEMIGPERLAELEPEAAGVRAIHVPSAGIVDYVEVCRRLAARIEARGGQIVTRARATEIKLTTGGVTIGTSAGDHTARYAINCAGLHCDRVAKLSGRALDAKIIPFRGEYFELKPDARHLVKNLIYPVPDPNFPFLGVHFTRMIGGGVECGPNAVLAFAREGYHKTDINLRDLAESLTYPGFIKLALRHFRMGLGEMHRSVSKRAFVKALSRLLPAIEAKHLEPAPSGVRAQAVARDGSMVDDFLFEPNDRILNVGNAPSPAATASLNIGKLIIDRVPEGLI